MLRSRRPISEHNGLLGNADGKTLYTFR